MWLSGSRDNVIRNNGFSNNEVGIMADSTLSNNTLDNNGLTNNTKRATGALLEIPPLPSTGPAALPENEKSGEVSGMDSLPGFGLLAGTAIVTAGVILIVLLLAFIALSCRKKQK